MKHNLAFLLLFLGFLGFSQSPQLINYQGVARDASGLPISGSVGLKFELHQGSANAEPVFTEEQTVTTGSLGVFSTQIGKTTGSDLNTINWEGGSLFLEVSISLSGGTYTSMGVQQLVSVPYALEAASVPVTYSNNVLTVGAQVFTLSSAGGAVYTASTGISITSGSVITNTAPDVPVTFTSSSSNITINGTYPDFGISYSATPVPTSLTLNGANNNSLSAGNNTVVLNTYTVGTGLNMTGGPNYTITSSSASPTIEGAGIALVTPTTGTSFTVTVPNPSVSVTGSLLTLTQGTSVSTAIINPPTLALSGASNNSLTAGNNTVTLNTYTAGSGISMTGGPNYTISSSAASPSIQGTGVAVVSPTTGSNFIVSVPNPSISATNTLLTLTQGASTSTTTINNYTVGSGLTMTGGPNYTITSSAASPSIQGTGVAVVSPTTGSNFIVSVPNPSISATNTLLTLTQGTSTSTTTINNYTVGSGLTMTGGPNYTITSSATSPSIQGAGVAVVSPTTGSNFVVTVPNPSIAVTNNTLLTVSQGTSVSTAIINPPTLSLSGTNNNSLTAGNNTVTLNTYTVGSGLTMAGGPNYTINASASNPTINGTGIAVVSPTTGSSFAVNVPAPVLSVTGTTLGISQGTASSSAVIPTTTVTASGIASVVASGLSYNVDVPTPSFLATGATSIQGSYPNYTVVTPAPSSATLVGTGAAVITPSTGTSYTVNVPPTSITVTTGIANVSSIGTNSFNLNVPSPVYNAVTGALNTGTASTNITPALTFTNNILTSGPATNSVTLPALVNTSISPAGSASVTGAFPSFTVSAPAQPTIVGTGLAVVSPSTGANISVNVPLLTYTPATGVLASGSNSLNITQPLVISGTTLSSGPASNSINLNSLSPFTSTGANIYQTTLSNSVGIGTNAPSAKLEVLESAGYTGSHLKVQNINTSNTSNMVDFTSLGGGNVLNVFSNNSSTATVAGLFDGGIISKGKTITNSGYALRALDASSSDLFVVRNDGNVGVGTANPVAMLHVNNNLLGTNGLVVDVNNVASSAIAAQIRHFGTGNAGYFEMNNTASGGHAIIATSNSNNQHTVRSLNTSTTLTAYAGMFEGGLVGRGKNDPTGLALMAKDFAGSDLFVVKNNGNVGIATNNPVALLDVNNTGTLFDGIAVNVSNTANGGNAVQVRHFGVGNAGYFEVNNSTSNARALEITSNSGNQHALTATTTGTSLTTYAGYFDGGVITRGKNNLSSAYAFRAQNSSSSDLLSVQNDGFVGIGTSNPATKLHLHSNTSNFVQVRLTHTATSSFGLVLSSDASNATLLNYDNTNFFFGTNGANRMVISNTGSVGIGPGAMAPAARLDIDGTVKISDGTQGLNKVLTSDAVGNASWQALLPVPSGAIIAYGGNVIPSGWVVCDGAAISRTGVNANLFAAVGTSWGAGNGTTTFNVPDMRGMFLRGVDGGSGNDPNAATRVVSNTGGNTGNNVGSKQADAYQSHSHALPNNVTNTTNYSTLLGGTAALDGSGGASTSGASGASTETRPKNVYVYYIIKL